MTPANPNPDTSGRVVRTVIWLPGLAVAVGAAAATAHGLYEVALAARVPAGIAWLYPLITDGLALVAYTATARLRGRAARYAWAVVVLAAGLSGLAQAAYLAGEATLTAPPALRFGLGAWPAVAAAVVAHLLYLLAAADEPGQRGDAPTGPEVPTAGAGSHAAPDDHRYPSGSTAPRAVLGVQPRPYTPRPYTPPAVQREPSNPNTAGPADTRRAVPGEQPAGHGEHRPYSGAGERPGPVERPAAGPTPLPPGDRARAAAARHARRHGALPTVSELVATAEVSRGTAAAALKALRAQPTPLHLVPDNPGTPDPRTRT